MAKEKVNEEMSLEETKQVVAFCDVLAERPILHKKATCEKWLELVKQANDALDDDGVFKYVCQNYIGNKKISYKAFCALPVVYIAFRATVYNRMHAKANYGTKSMQDILSCHEMINSQIQYIEEEYGKLDIKDAELIYGLYPQLFDNCEWVLPNMSRQGFQSMQALSLAVTMGRNVKGKKFC